MPIAFKLAGLADGRRTPYDGEYLMAFDFEAADGAGEATFTPLLEEALTFPDNAAAFEFYKRQPKCRPTRGDGKPNCPMTATNWVIALVEVLARDEVGGARPS